MNQIKKIPNTEAISGKGYKNQENFFLRSLNAKLQMTWNLATQTPILILVVSHSPFLFLYLSLITLSLS